MISKAIEYAKEVAETRFPYGALNRIDCQITKNKPLHKGQLDGIVALYKFPLEIGVELLDSPMYTYLKGGFCDHIAAYAAKKIKEKFPKLQVELVCLDFHLMIVLGRNLDSDPYDIKTWQDAIIVDLWADQTYKTTEFDIHRKAAPEIRYAQLTKKLENNKITEKYVESAGTTYLEGNPQIDFSSTLSILKFSPQLFEQYKVAYTKSLFKKYQVNDITSCYVYAVLANNIRAALFLAQLPEFSIIKIFPDKTYTALDLVYQKKKLLEKQNAPMHDLVKNAELIKVLKQLGAKTAVQLMQDEYKNDDLNICLRRAVFMARPAHVRVILAQPDVNINSFSPTKFATALDMAKEQEATLTLKEKSGSAENTTLLTIRECITLLLEKGAKPYSEVTAKPPENLSYEYTL